MSHNVRYRDYPENVNKRKVQTDWDTFVAHEDWQEGASGLPSGIRWIDSVICNSYDAAQKYIESIDSGWYDQLAVRYHVTPKSKKLDELRNIVQTTMKKYRDAESALYADGVKSAFIGCKKCGSKLNREYVKRNTCPLCGQDFRSDTTKARILAAKKKYESAVTNLQNCEASLAKKNSELRWLVKVEYHT